MEKKLFIIAFFSCMCISNIVSESSGIENGSINEADPSHSIANISSSVSSDTAEKTTKRTSLPLTKSPSSRYEDGEVGRRRQSHLSTNSKSQVCPPMAPTCPECFIGPEDVKADICDYTIYLKVLLIADPQIDSSGRICGKFGLLSTHKNTTEKEFRRLLRFSLMENCTCHLKASQLYFLLTDESSFLKRNQLYHQVSLSEDSLLVLVDHYSEVDFRRRIEDCSPITTTQNPESSESTSETDALQPRISSNRTIPRGSRIRGPSPEVFERTYKYDHSSRVNHSAVLPINPVEPNQLYYEPDEEDAQLTNGPTPGPPPQPTYAPPPKVSPPTYAPLPSSTYGPPPLPTYAPLPPPPPTYAPPPLPTYAPLPPPPPTYAPPPLPTYAPLPPPTYAPLPPPTYAPLPPPTYVQPPLPLSPYARPPYAYPPPFAYPPLQWFPPPPPVFRPPVMFSPVLSNCLEPPSCPRTCASIVDEVDFVKAYCDADFALLAAVTLPDRYMLQTVAQNPYNGGACLTLPTKIVKDVSKRSGPKDLRLDLPLLLPAACDCFSFLKGPKIVLLLAMFESIPSLPEYQLTRNHDLFLLPAPSTISLPVCPPNAPPYSSASVHYRPIQVSSSPLVVQEPASNPSIPAPTCPYGMHESCPECLGALEQWIVPLYCSAQFAVVAEPDHSAYSISYSFPIITVTAATSYSAKKIIITISTPPKNRCIQGSLKIIQRIMVPWNLYTPPRDLVPFVALAECSCAFLTSGYGQRLLVFSSEAPSFLPNGALELSKDLYAVPLPAYAPLPNCASLYRHEHVPDEDPFPVYITPPSYPQTPTAPSLPSVYTPAPPPPPVKTPAPPPPPVKTPAPPPPPVYTPAPPPPPVKTIAPPPPPVYTPAPPPPPVKTPAPPPPPVYTPAPPPPPVYTPAPPPPVKTPAPPPPPVYTPAPPPPPPVYTPAPPPPPVYTPAPPPPPPVYTPAPPPPPPVYTPAPPPPPVYTPAPPPPPPVYTPAPPPPPVYTPAPPPPPPVYTPAPPPPPVYTPAPPPPPPVYTPAPPPPHVYTPAPPPPPPVYTPAPPPPPPVYTPAPEPYNIHTSKVPPSPTLKHCPTFDRTCPICSSVLPQNFKDFFCLSPFAVVVAIGLDFKVLERENEDPRILPFIPAEKPDFIHIYDSVKYTYNLTVTPEKTAKKNSKSSYGDTCYTEKVRSILGITKTYKPFEVLANLEIYIPEDCKCETLDLSPAFAILLSQTRPTDLYQPIQLSSQFALFPLPLVKTAIPVCNPAVPPPVHSPLVLPHTLTVYKAPRVQAGCEASPCFGDCDNIPCVEECDILPPGLTTPCDARVVLLIEILETSAGNYVVPTLEITEYLNENYVSSFWLHVKPNEQPSEISTPGVKAPLYKRCKYLKARVIEDISPYPSLPKGSNITVLAGPTCGNKLFSQANGYAVLISKEIIKPHAEIPLNRITLKCIPTGITILTPCPANPIHKPLPLPPVPYNTPLPLPPSPTTPPSYDPPSPTKAYEPPTPSVSPPTKAYEPPSPYVSPSTKAYEPPAPYVPPSTKAYETPAPSFLPPTKAYDPRIPVYPPSPTALIPGQDDSPRCPGELLRSCPICIDSDSLKPEAYCNAEWAVILKSTANIVRISPSCSKATMFTMYDVTAKKGAIRMLSIAEIFINANCDCPALDGEGFALILLPQKEAATHYTFYASSNTQLVLMKPGKVSLPGCKKLGYTLPRSGNNEPVRLEISPPEWRGLLKDESVEECPDYDRSCPVCKTMEDEGLKDLICASEEVYKVIKEESSSGLQKFSNKKISLTQNTADNFTAVIEIEPYQHEDVCTQPLKKGKCNSSIPRYYYDDENGECGQFTFSGCEGNGNNFETEEKCEETCQMKAMCREGSLTVRKTIKTSTDIGEQEEKWNYSIPDYCECPSLLSSKQPGYLVYNDDNLDELTQLTREFFIVPLTESQKHLTDMIESCSGRKEDSGNDFDHISVTEGNTSNEEDSTDEPNYETGEDGNDDDEFEMRSVKEKEEEQYNVKNDFGDMKNNSGDTPKKDEKKGWFTLPKWS